MRAAGTLNEPMLLLRPETTNGTDGSVTRSYQQVAMVWGQVEASTGSEATTAGRISSSYHSPSPFAAAQMWLRLAP